MTTQKEQPVSNQYLAIVDEMFNETLPPHLKSHCEICKCEISGETYDNNLGVCDSCNERLE